MSNNNDIDSKNSTALSKKQKKLIAKKEKRIENRKWKRLNKHNDPFLAVRHKQKQITNNKKKKAADRLLWKLSKKREREELENSCDDDDDDDDDVEDVEDLDEDVDDNNNNNNNNNDNNNDNNNEMKDDDNDDEKIIILPSNIDEEVINSNSKELNVSFELDLKYRDLSTHANVELVLGHFLFNLTTLIDLDISSIYNLTFGEVSGDVMIPCLLSVMKVIKLKKLGMNVGDIDADVSIIGGGGGLNISAPFNDSQKLNEYFDKFDKLSHKLVDAITDQMCHDTPYLCAKEPIPSKTASSEHSRTLALIALLTGSCMLLLLAYIFWTKKLGYQCRKKCSSTNYSFDENSKTSALLDDDLSVNQHNNNKSIAWRESLYFDERIPFFVRIMVPLTLVGTILMFLISNLGVGATVAVKLQVGDQELDLGEMFSFSLSNTVRDMWTAKVYGLSIIVAVFSGGWPYLKLVLMLLAWHLPPDVLNIKRRETLLKWLDRLGKWSLIDAFVMVMFLVAFRFHIVVEKDLIANVFVVPKLGLYLFVLATMISLVMSHILLAAHRHTTTKYVVPSGGKREALSCHHHRILLTSKPLMAKNNSYVSLNDDNYDGSNTIPATARCTIFGRILVGLLVLFSMLLLFAGVTFDTFTFDFRGAVSLVMKDSALSSYSLVSLGEKLPASVSNPDSFGIRWLQLVYFVFALGMPALYLIVLLLLWSIPMTLQMQRALLVLTEVSYAWAALEVFIVSVLAATLQISQFASFMVGDRCDLINIFLAAFFDTQLHGDDVCFDLVASFGQGCWILFAAALIYQLLGYLLGDANAAAVEDRLQAYYSATTHRLTSKTNDPVNDEYDELEDTDDLLEEKDSIGFMCRQRVNQFVYYTLEKVGILKIQISNNINHRRNSYSADISMTYTPSSNDHNVNSNLMDPPELSEFDETTIEQS